VKALSDALEIALGRRAVRFEPLCGGDINEAYRVTLEGGESVFVKTNARAPRAMFPAEARGLAWLAKTGAVRIPKVLAVADEDTAGPSFLVLEYLEPGRSEPGFDEHLGHSLAELHRAGAPQFGLDHDNFIGRLPQSNAPRATWAEFYGEERLLGQLRLAERSGLATTRLCQGLERLVLRLPDLVGDAEPPARLHGDLWGGNLHRGPAGEPVLIDPAVYGGHREVDLAMMQLFGGFSERVFEAYEAAHPLSPGAPERVALYQLYPLLVHVNLFGGSYVASAERSIFRYV
jgi:fructosamine-3-kinase